MFCTIWKFLMRVINTSTVRSSSVKVLLYNPAKGSLLPASLTQTMEQLYSECSSVNLCTPWLSYTPPSTSFGSISVACVGSLKKSLWMETGVKANGTHEEAVTARATGNLSGLNKMGGC